MRAFLPISSSSSNLLFSSFSFLSFFFLLRTDTFAHDYTSPWNLSSERGWRMNQAPLRRITLRVSANQTEIQVQAEHTAECNWRVTIGDRTMEVSGSICEDGTQIQAMVDGNSQLVSFAIVKDTVYLFSGDEQYEFELDIHEFDSNGRSSLSLSLGCVPVVDELLRERLLSHVSF
jgi:hypothetical protein